ncbi:DNA/RNA helicase domain-containing protein [Nocardiopsis sp. ATB16-24]|uniref:DNA/RNA helicase domain-containing protein n=1 Tax=Nocardiopsis sp. ATB16-24 TaxID=3019555 RepID=UPI002554BE08|nr:DNA/RNA helicase domain-containing protein [Nocardiopsis sp. ATB16-24]
MRKPDFVERCVLAYGEAGFGEPEESEIRSWRNSWPPLLDALVSAGLEDLYIYLEFATLDTESRIDALLIGRRGSGELAATVVELKQWTEAVPVAKNLVRLPGDERLWTHPLAQTVGYMAFLDQWFESDAVDLETRGVVFLHNATRSQAARVQESGVLPHGYRVPVVSGEDTRASSGPAELRGLFQCGDLQGPDERDLASFTEARWRGSEPLLDSVAAAVNGAPSFKLVGDQQTALLDIRARVQEALDSGRRTVIVVQGGPGSGKTVLAMRLLGEYVNNPAVRARYGTPSGALTRNLREILEVPGSNPLFQLPKNKVRDSRLLIIDEVHRYHRGGGGLGTYVLKNLAEVPVVVLFLDERQRVRPREGVTEREIRGFAQNATPPINVVTHNLNGNFRCNGSREFNSWVDDLLYEQPRPWTGTDYDLAVSLDPSEMEQWLEESLEQERTARISAGFCWGWEEVRLGEKLPGVSIEWEDGSHGETRKWERPWNLHKDQTIAADGEFVGPESWLWATGPGGERQIGCVYTAQGLEYHDAGVILGPDLVRRDDRWEAHPEESRDRGMRGVESREYLSLAKNIYRVLMTRGMRSCRLYSTDEETQEFLTSLVPSASR